MRRMPTYAEINFMDCSGILISLVGMWLSTYCKVASTAVLLDKTKTKMDCCSTVKRGGPLVTEKVRKN